jgi:hypothetical protein
VARYEIAALEVVLPALDRAHACRQGVLEAHRLATVPPWKPYARSSLPYVTAEPEEYVEGVGSLFEEGFVRQRTGSGEKAA